jgi:hypothetical protein
MATDGVANLNFWRCCLFFGSNSFGVGREVLIENLLDKIVIYTYSQYYDYKPRFGRTSDVTTVDRFRAAVEAREVSALEPLFTEDARFYSPMKFSAFVGRPVVLKVFGVLLTQVFEDFRYVGELAGTAETAAGGSVESHVMVFRATVGDKQVHGIDLIQLDEIGLIQEFTVMLRPRSALDTVAKKVAEGLVAEGLLPASALAF